MPLKVTINDKEKWISPTSEWASEKISEKELEVNRNFYIEVNKI